MSQNTDILAMCQTPGWAALLAHYQDRLQQWELYQRGREHEISDYERGCWQGRQEMLQALIDTEASAELLENYAPGE